MQWSTFLLCVVLTLSLSLPSTSAHAQTDTSRGASQTVPSVGEAWSQIRTYHKSGEHARADSAQRALARAFFDYYRAHPTSKTAQKRVSTAFMMWGNAGAADAVDTALTHVKRDQAVWKRVINGAGNAYYRADRSDEFISRLKTIAPELTHPEAQAAEHAELGEHRLTDRDTTEARAHYQKIVDLDANPTQVRKAQGMLYEIDSLRVGQPAPDFTAETIAGRRVSLSDLRGTVVLLEFWATNCGPCLLEIPHLKTLHDKYADEDFALVGVSQDDSLSTLRTFLEKRDMSWPQIQSRAYFEDRTLKMEVVSKRYNVFRIPRSFLIDRDGRIFAKDLRGENMVSKVESVLASGG